MKNKLYILLVVVLLSSCSVWEMIKPSSGLSIDKEIVAGDKNQKVHTEVGATTNTADSIVQNIDNVDYWLLGVAILGWVLPTPRTMFIHVTRRFRKKE